MPERLLHLARPWRLVLVTAGALVTLVALFADAGEALPRRSQHYLWDLGHVLLGGGAQLALVLLWPGLRRRPAWVQLALASTLGLAFGGTTELAQGQLGRDASWRDLGLDTVGALGAVLLLLSRDPARPQASRLRHGLTACTLLLALPLPWLAYAWDEGIQHETFPILADGEARFEASRFEGAERMHLPDGPGYGEALCLPPGKRWAGVSLRYFPGNWRGYRQLSYRLYWAGHAPLRLGLRIDDREHVRRGQFHHDRYNGLVVLQPGWNTLNLALDTMRNTAGGRRMDLGEIHQLRWFTLEVLDAEQCFILDELRLLP